MQITKQWAALAGCLSIAAIALSGCTPEARQDVGDAKDKIGDATAKSAEGTAQAVNKAGEKVADTGKAAVQGTEKAVAKTGEAIATGTEKVVQGTEKAVVKTGQAVKTGTKEVVQGTEKAVVKTGEAVKQTGAVVGLTPKVRNAIIADDKVKMLDLNVDTKADSKEVVVMGTAGSAAEKAAAIADAKKALAGDTSGYKIVDQIKVGAKK